jgi:hypothetical protein
MLLPSMCSRQLLLSTAEGLGLKLNHKASGIRVGVLPCHTAVTCRPSSVLPASTAVSVVCGVCVVSVVCGVCVVSG